MTKQHSKKNKHLTSIQHLSKPFIEKILLRANYFLNNFIKPQKITNSLEGKLIANLFFETSTRTRNSFAIAAQRLGAILIEPNSHTLALQKGESLLDTIHTLEAMGVSLFVIRHFESSIVQWIADRLQPETAIINAGDGNHQHPTQALLDLLTIQNNKSNWQDLVIAFIGDVRYSRVAPSLIDGLNIMGVKQIRIISPPNLMPEKILSNNIKIFETINPGLEQADVVISLRLQKERMPSSQIVQEEAFHEKYGLTAKRLALAKPDAIVMHPGPMNRNVEIAPEVADGNQSVILEQVCNGVAIRMALMEDLLS